MKARRRFQELILPVGLIAICGLAVASVNPIREYMVLRELETAEGDRRINAINAASDMGLVDALPKLLGWAFVDKNILFAPSLG